MVDVPIRHRTPDPLRAGPLRDILLPASDRTAMLQVVVVLAVTIAAALLVRRERSLVLVAIGLGMTVLGLMALRTLH